MGAIQTQLKQAISDVSSKSSAVAEGSFSSDVAAQRSAAAYSAVNAKEAVVNSKETALDATISKLETPPKTQLTEKGDCGRSETKTVVDKEAVAKLQAEKKATETQLALAKAEVGDARQEAATASTEALNAAGISKELQSEMQSLMDRVYAMQDGLKDDKPVKAEDIDKLTKDLKTITNSLTQGDNQSGAITKSFYTPVQKGLKEISDLITKTPGLLTGESAIATAATSTSSSTSTSSTSTSTSSSSSDTEVVTPVPNSSAG